MKFSRQQYWSGLPVPPPGYPLYPETEPMSLASPSLGGIFFTTVPPEKAFTLYNSVLFNFYVCVLCAVKCIPVSLVIHTKIYNIPYNLKKKKQNKNQPALVMHAKNYFMLSKTLMVSLITKTYSI